MGGLTSEAFWAVATLWSSSLVPVAQSSRRRVIRACWRISPWLPTCCRIYWNSCERHRHDTFKANVFKTRELWANVMHTPSIARSKTAWQLDESRRVFVKTDRPSKVIRLRCVAKQRRTRRGRFPATTSHDKSWRSARACPKQIKSWRQCHQHHVICTVNENESTVCHGGDRWQWLQQPAGASSSADVTRGGAT